MKILPTNEQAVQNFSKVMLRELNNNSHKGNRSDWVPQDSDIYREIQHHLSKMRVAVEMKRKKDVTEYAADLANFCMKLHETFGDSKL
jgi:hypothetical protein